MINAGWNGSKGQSDRAAGVGGESGKFGRGGLSRGLSRPTWARDYLSSRLRKPAGSSPVDSEFDFWGETSERLREV